MAKTKKKKETMHHPQKEDCKEARGKAIDKSETEEYSSYKHAWKAKGYNETEILKINEHREAKTIAKNKFCARNYLFQHIKEELNMHHWFTNTKELHPKPRSYPKSPLQNLLTDDCIGRIRHYKQALAYHEKERRNLQNVTDSEIHEQTTRYNADNYNIYTKNIAGRWVVQTTTQ